MCIRSAPPRPAAGHRRAPTSGPGDWHPEYGPVRGHSPRSVADGASEIAPRYTRFQQTTLTYERRNPGLKKGALWFGLVPKSATRPSRVRTGSTFRLDSESPLLVTAWSPKCVARASASTCFAAFGINHMAVSSDAADGFWCLDSWVTGGESMFGLNVPGFRKSVVLLVAAAGLAYGQPALTNIQDILYRADGTRFSGTMFITWSSFLAGDTSNIATANLTLPIVNGVLNVKLVPTTTASAGAQYNVTYASGGVNQFTEVWAVPPSGPKLRVRDVRLSSGTVIGPAPSTTPIQVGDVTGLANALAVRPTEGAGYSIGRAAVINPSGQIDAASGNLGDCMHVDGSSGACGTGGSGGSGGILPLYSDAETPGGTLNGINAAFTLLFAPSPVNSLILFRNGLLQTHGFDFALAGNVVTFLPGSIPQAGDELSASYRYANPNNVLGTLTAAQVICSSAGIGTSGTVATTLGSCTIPAGLLTTGDRIEVQFYYLHTGTAATFTAELHWGAATVLSRTSAASETALAGHVTFGVLGSTQSWDAQSWGNNFALANVVGSAAANTSLSLTLTFPARLGAATGDVISLSNFTVIRYPAQTNP